MNIGSLETSALEKGVRGGDIVTVTLATMVPGGELSRIPPFGWTVTFVATMPWTGGVEPTLIHALLKRHQYFPSASAKA